MGQDCQIAFSTRGIRVDLRSKSLKYRMAKAAFSKFATVGNLLQHNSSLAGDGRRPV